MTTDKPVVKTITSARVTVQIDVDVGQWGPECSTAQVYAEAVEAAHKRVRNAFNLERMRIRTIQVESISTRVGRRYD